MKTSCFVVALLAFGILNIQAAQTTAASTDASQIAVPKPTAYRVIDAGANHRVWQNETYEKSPDGQVYTHIHTVKELCSGLNFLKAGQWVESKEQIEVLPQGGAAAVQGQHQAYFPGDIYNGFIELVTPDGQHLKSRPLGLSYDDGNNTVFIAVLTNSIGQLVGSNQVIYPDAFTGFKADLVFTYTKAGFEQDIVVRAQPPTPESLGLNPATARLQVLTEFFSPPQPAIQARKLAAQAGLSLTDQSLGFGAMQMVPGRAFLLGNNAVDSGAQVGKQWLLLDGRQFLVEEVPVDAIADGLATLPLTAMSSGSTKTSHTASRHLALSPQRLVKNTSKTMMLAKAGLPAQGFVLDYQTVNSSLTDYTFQGDTTYYISGAVNLSGTNNIFEGGAVLKYASNAAVFISIGMSQPAVRWQASAYRPVIFTAKDDNTVGEVISGSTGNPSGYYANPAIALIVPSFAPAIANFRIAYARQAMNLVSVAVPISNGQIINCQNGISVSGGGGTLENVLSANVLTNFNISGGANFKVQNVTFSGSGWLITQPDQYNSFSFTNCIFANVTNLYNIAPISFSGSYNGFYNTPNFGSTTVPNYIYPFQTVGGGSYYLTNGCNFFNQGTTNIDAILLAGLKQRTTYPPIVYANQTISVPLTLSPQAQRDTDTPDLGYHYDPLDFVFGGCDLYANLTFTADTAVGWYEGYGSVSSSGQPYGISLNNGANLTLTGTVAQPCWVVRFNFAQESVNGNWGAHGWMSGLMFNGSGSGTTPQLNAQFTKWSCPDAVGGYFRDNWAYGVAHVSDCEFYNSGFGSYWPSLYFTNCLFSRIGIAFWDQVDAASLTFQNCTFYNGGLAMSRVSGQSSSFWTIKNTAFDGTDFWTQDNFNGNTNYTAFDYNAYNSNNLSWQTYPFPYPPTYGTLETVGPHDMMVTNYNWQSSWLGNYYLPSDSPLIDAGSTTADQVGLYQFTTQTNQVKEGFSYVDIGYHYVAVDANTGQPYSTYTNGIPDYIVDADGNGLPDWWEWYWFGNYTHTGSERDANGNTLLSDYQNGTDPNIIQFSIEVANNYVSTSYPTLQLDVTAGVPGYYAVLMDSTNFTGATWTNYTSASITANLGSLQGWHELWVGLRGLPAEAQQTRVWKRLKLDTAPPQLVITSPTNSTGNVPLIQVQGYSPEALASISYDLTNALGLVTNQQTLIINQHYNTNTWEFTTNTFQAFDVPLTNGVNKFTFHAQDLAGNVTTLTTNITLDYSSKTNPPVIQNFWPQNGATVCGSNFIWNGWVSDPTVAVLAQLVNTNGTTNTFSGAVGRTGDYWVQNLPLNSGTNHFSLTVTDVRGNSATTNLTVMQGNSGLSIDPIASGQTRVTGKINSPNYTISVNGTAATIYGDGTWSADNVPIEPHASLVQAMASSGGPTEIAAVAADNHGIYLESYGDGYHDHYTFYTNGVVAGTYDGNFEINWTDKGGGRDIYHWLSTGVASPWWSPGGDEEYSTNIWPATPWPEAFPVVDGIPLSCDGGEGGYIASHNAFMGLQSCVAKFQNTYYVGSEDKVEETFSEGGQAHLTLATGGEPGSTKLNLWMVSASAKERAFVASGSVVEDPPVGEVVRDIPFTDIVAGVFGQLDEDGNAFKLLSDNAFVDITPYVAGVDYYTFNDPPGPVMLTGLTVVSNAVAVGGTNNWAAVKTNDYVYVKATLSMDDTNAANQIVWSAGDKVSYDPFQRKISKATSAKYIVTATLGSTNKTVNVWIVWLNESKFNTTGPQDSDSDVAPPTFGTTGDITHNGMLMQWTISPAGFGAFTNVPYDIKRTKERATWSRNGTTWQQSTHVGPGADDDSVNTDEDLTPSTTDHVYVEDWPGFQSSTAFADEAVYKASFVEFVNIQLGGNWLKCSDNYAWHSITWLENGGTLWQRKTGEPNEITPGSATVGTNSTP